MSQNLFSDELNSFIDQWKEKKGNLIMILHKVQQEFGYISREAAQEVADKLGVPLATIWGVVTFYHFFKLNKPGKYNIQVCLGTACYLKGGDIIIDELEKQVGLTVGGLTEDGRFSLEAVRCVGCCGLAPVMTISGLMTVRAITMIPRTMFMIPFERTAERTPLGMLLYLKKAYRLLQPSNIMYTANIAVPIVRKLSGETIMNTPIAISNSPATK